MRFAPAAAGLLAAVLSVVAAPAPAAERIAGGCDPDFEVVDHRGAHHKWDENTVPAIVAGARRGESVELDVRATVDGRLVLMHDATVDRTTTGSGLVAATTFEQLRTYVTEPGGEVIPTLRQAMRAAGPYGIDVYLDVKDKSDTTLLAVAQVVRRASMVDRTLVTSWNGKMRLLAPDISRQWKPDGPAPTASEVVDRGVESVGLFPQQMSEYLVESLRAAGVEVHSRLVSTVAAWDQVTAYPIQGALTNTPVGLTTYCTNK